MEVFYTDKVEVTEYEHHVAVVPILPIQAKDMDDASDRLCLLLFRTPFYKVVQSDLFTIGNPLGYMDDAILIACQLYYRHVNLVPSMKAIQRAEDKYRKSAFVADRVVYFPS